MIDFCPDGYLPILKAVATAARYWFAERFSKLENSTPSQQGTELESPIEKAVRIFSQPPIPDDWRQAFEEIKGETVHRLQNLLHQGKLHGCYFADFSWEREGRVRGDLKFSSRDIVCLILPADREEPLKGRMAENGIAVISPG